MPDFVIEVMSPNDRAANGANLAWLVDSDRTVHAYRHGTAAPEHHVDVATLAGDGPIIGFVADLTDVWEPF